VTGSDLVVVGAVGVTGGQADINAAVTFEPTAAVTVAAGAELNLNAQTTFRGGTYSGVGTIQQNAAATVATATTLAVGYYDMDGASGTTLSTLNDTLTLNVTGVGKGNNVFNGTLNINNPGALIVNTPTAWQMGGTMNLDQNGGPADAMLVGGADAIITGQVNVAGQVGIASRVALLGTVLLPGAGDHLQLGVKQANTIHAGKIAGSGRLTASGGSLAGHGTIGADVEFFNSADLLANAGTLSVSGVLLEVGDIGTSSATGTLEITNAWNTNVAERLVLAGGQVTGAAITNSGATIGHGTIAAANFTNNGTVTADGGRLTLATTAFPDLDGSGSEDGLLNTGAETIHITTKRGSLFPFNGQLTVGLGGRFLMDYDGLTISSAPTAGRMTLSGGTYEAPELILSSVLLVNTATSTIDSASQFRSGSSSTLNRDLKLDGNATVFDGAVFAGSGDLVVEPGAALGIADGVSLGVDLVNHGVVNLGASPGIVTVVGYFRQDSGGTLQIEIAGADNSNPNNPQYDALNVTGWMHVEGELEISLLGGFTPDYGNTFDVLDFGDMGVTRFDTVELPALAGRKAWDISDLYTTGEISAIGMLDGDTDSDRDVDSDDLLALVAVFGSNGDWRTDFNEDGRVDLADFALQRANFGAGVGSSPLVDAPAATPEPATLILLAVGGLAVLKNRRRR
jgi:hypothetical protein